jgi:hypothetical protein
MKRTRRIRFRTKNAETRMTRIGNKKMTKKGWTRSG